MLNNNKGMTIIEILVSMVLLLFVSMAVMQMGLVGIQTNVKNSARDEAVNIAEKRINELRSLKFDDPQLNPTPPGGQSDSSFAPKFRGGSLTFNLDKIITLVNTSKLVSIRVTWTIKNQTYTHVITTMLRNE